MNFWDFAILSAVGLLAGFALYRMRTARRSGSCCGACADCHGCSASCPALGQQAEQRGNSARAADASADAVPQRERSKTP
ncbi:MAG: FeoB-associated Cys-rich membrane protein [Oscillospiraceae bacterium]|nr:FeoB-associated Cys-rich membrane protein [Oscillospiraceae bacterium]